MNKLILQKSSYKIIWILIAFILLPTFNVLINNSINLYEWEITTMFSSPIIFTILIDPKGIIFSIIVLAISANVLHFSSIYMREDKFINRFTALVILFVISINMLIFFPHFIIILLGWDGLGIVSFILVVYYQDPKSLGAGIITALINRIGDVILLLSIAWTLNQGHWNILYIWSSNMNYIQVPCIVLAGITKSAQIPFSSWLPAAIAAPTPVSALVHSSTLVTAGVFLLIRFHPFIRKFKEFGTLILVISVTTIIMAGIRASTECDIKKIIALSTLSQLGIIMARIGINISNMAYFHISTHALFKALLFICAGKIIITFSHRTDLRWIGNSLKSLPVTSSCILLSRMSLCGFPFLAGFYSKDAIIENIVFYSFNRLIILIFYIAVGITTFYSIRIILITLWGPKNRKPFTQAIEENNIKLPIIILSTISVIMGSIILWIFPFYVSITHISQNIKNVPLLLIMIGLLLSWITRIFIKKSIIIYKPKIHFYLCGMWFMSQLSSQFIIKYPLILSHQYLKSSDQAWIEYILAQGTNNIITKIFNRVTKFYPSNPSLYLSSSVVIFTALIILTRLL